ncbi:response regulator [Salinifilum aidingensis]
MPTVVVIAEAPDAARAFRAVLSPHGYEVLDATAPEEAEPDARIVDFGAATDAGAVARLRTRSDAPVLAVAPRDSPGLRAELLNAGADDCVSRPFDVGEFLARLQAVTRRGSGGSTPDVVRTPSFAVHLDAKKVARGEIAVRLTPTEWAILEILVRADGALVSQQDLLTRVWGSDYARQTHYLRGYLAQLRRKLEPEPDSPRHFITEPGRGYRFEI